MASSFHRPAPRGVNRRGGPTWDGRELKLYRRAMGARQTDIAKRLSTHASALSYLYENLRAPVAVRFQNVVKYLDAIERDAAWNDRDAAGAATELVALQAAFDSKAADLAAIRGDEGGPAMTTSKRLRFEGQPAVVHSVTAESTQFAPLRGRDERYSFVVIAADGFVYWIAETVPEDGPHTVTMREIDYADGGLTLGRLVSKKQIVLSPELALEMAACFEWDDDGAEVESESDDRRNVPDELGKRANDYIVHEIVATFTSMARMVGARFRGDDDDDDRGSTPVYVGFGGAKEKTTAELLDDAWPDDDWAGTADEIRDLLDDDDRSIDTVKKALQRGPFISDQVPGKPSVWKRIAGPQR